MVDWQGHYKKLVAKSRSKGVKVTSVKDRTTRDYVGMNDLAAKKMGFPMKSKTIYIDRNLPYRVKCHTLNHEQIERDLMSKGDSYWTAHKKALKREKRMK